MTDLDNEDDPFTDFEDDVVEDEPTVGEIAPRLSFSAAMCPLFMIPFTNFGSTLTPREYLG